jgi:peptidoglycan/LPS O-acetylase OafA/YrhL
VPALDGLRGVAVVGVLAFHLGHLEGGYLGVDLFFVLSGYLITSLLLAEHTDTGRISLPAFWARRARRLLPALFVVLAAVAVYAWTDPAGLVASALRADALATIAYVANWHEIAGDAGYWDLFSQPSLLDHTWSLAIEEQLYIVWPLVVVVALRFGRRALLATSLAVAAASALAMIVLHGAGDDTARTYFGTDTRAAAVLVGAALACWRGRRPAALQLAVIPLAVAWFTVGGTDSGLYEGGFIVCSVLAAAVIAGATRPGPLSRALSIAPLRHLGIVSYGVYLWHWPVFIVLDAETDLSGWPLLVAKVVVTFALAELSYRLLELPIRRGSLVGWRVRVSAPAAAGAVVAAVVFGTAVPASTSTEVPAPPPPPTTAADAPPADPAVTRLLVVGDSGAWYLGQGLEREAGDALVRNAGAISCGLLSAGGRMRLDGGGYVEDADWCKDWPDRWRMEVAALDPDVVLLVIAWPGLGDREVDGAWRHPCDPVFDAHYTELVREAVDLLGDTGARVVVADSPYVELPVQQADNRERIDCLNAIYRRAGAHAVLPLHDWAAGDGAGLRFDGVHFRDDAADIAADWILPQL